MAISLWYWRAQRHNSTCALRHAVQNTTFKRWAWTENQSSLWHYELIFHPTTPSLKNSQASFHSPGGGGGGWLNNKISRAWDAPECLPCRPLYLEHNQIPQSQTSLQQRAYSKSHITRISRKQLTGFPHRLAGARAFQWSQLSLGEISRSSFKSRATLATDGGSSAVCEWQSHRVTNVFTWRLQHIFLHWFIIFGA